MHSRWRFGARRLRAAGVSRRMDARVNVAQAPSGGSRPGSWGTIAAPQNRHKLKNPQRRVDRVGEACYS